jgi:hypothetical protein
MASETELGRCPNPDCDESGKCFRYIDYPAQQRVVCNCGISGPWGYTPEQAADGWNKLSQMADLLAAYGEPSTCSDCGPQKLCTEECDKMGEV